MPRVREDLIGSIYVAGTILRAGDSVPKGVTVSDLLLADSKRRATKTDDSASTDESQGGDDASS